MSLSALLDVIAPPLCLACDEPLTDGERRAPAAGSADPSRRSASPLIAGRDRALCPRCQAALPWLPAGCCPRCALPEVHHGLRCPADGFAFEAAWAPLAHRGTARALVGALKRSGQLPAGDLMAVLLARRFPRELPPDAVLVPVPAHPIRARRRGLDHARLLAARLERHCERPAASVLRRRQVRGERAQTGTPRHARLHATPSVQIRRGRATPRAALLVDDVHTTGATLHACALALRAAGSEWVGALTFTRTL